MSQKNLSILTTQPSVDYELIDSGDGEKLERYGEFTLRRPDPQALWNKRLENKYWKQADATFSRDGKKGGWEYRTKMPKRWQVNFGDLNMWVKPSAFKHTGIFPEQEPNWDWMRGLIESEKRKVKSEINVLNLFGYTGGASLACAQAGASVCHVDGSKVAVSWARDNADASGLADKPIRWILDDARVFVKREIKRGRKYDAIIMDPPAFGHGAKKEVWNIEKDFLPFVKMCNDVLSEDPLFFLLNGYAAGYSSLAYEHVLQELNLPAGTIERGEVTIAESNSDRVLPSGIFARWSNN